MKNINIGLVGYGGSHKTHIIALQWLDLIALGSDFRLIV